MPGSGWLAGVAHIARPKGWCDPERAITQRDSRQKVKSEETEVVVVVGGGQCNRAPTNNHEQLH
jgi:uridylate kinase